MRRFPVIAFAFLVLVACSTSKPATVTVDPVTDPTVVGAVDEGVREASIEAEAGAETGRRVGRVVGVLAAVFGGPSHESFDDTMDRYRRTRDAAEATGAIIGATRGGIAGGKRGFEMDVQFAELHKIEGVEVMRPAPDQIDVRFLGAPTPQTLAGVAAVFAGREERAIEIEGAGGDPFDVRESLIDLGLAGSSLTTHRNDHLRGVILRIRYRD